MSLSNDEPHQPQNDKPLHPPNNEPPHPPNDEPPHPPANQPTANQPQPPNPPGIDIDELSQLPKFHQAFSFIQALRAASLDDPVAKVTPEALEKLPIIHHGIKVYFHLEHAAQAAYKGIADSAARSFPGVEDIPSYCGVERLVAELSGIDSIKHHMCLNTCIAFTGPFSDLDQCPFCDSHRYDQLKLEATGKQVPVREFHTIPLGPQLQAIWRDPESAGRMHYRRERTAAIFQYLQQHDGKLHIIDDFICGSNYLEAVMQGRINENDMVLMSSMDGAQLYRSKISDCWIYIWVILDHHPSRPYKKQYVLPGGVIPGPKNPQNFDSFLFPGNEGLRIWDASRNINFTSHPFLALPTADALGLVHFDGMVGHSGRNGCRVYCGLIGRRKPQRSHYFPVLLKPLNYTVRGCSHDDVDVFNLPATGSGSYPTNLRHLVSSPNQTQFEKHRTETGIVKPSRLLGLNPAHVLGIPDCLTTDVMHLIAKISDLILSLWRGTIKCDTSDDVRTWRWAVFCDDDAWTEHGAIVGATTYHIPGSFDRPPRNPAEKLNTQYKTWEFQLYIFGLAPALLHTILPQDIWLNFCKLAQRLLGEWETEFEQLYHQCCHDRIHFIHLCVHQVNHLVLCYAQWTMEWTIGNLANALKSILPFLAPPNNVLPCGHQELGDGYVLLQMREKQPYRPPAIHVALLEDLVHAPLPQMHPCTDCSIKVIIDGTVCFAEVQYFTQVAITTENIGEWHDTNTAVISVFSAPDADLVRLSNQTVLSCKYLGDEGLRVVDVNSIKSVVAMILHRPTLPSGVIEDRFFVLERPGLNVYQFGVEQDQEDEIDQREMEAEERN
ncbi:hypothetical protein BDR03DRAFT_936586 [Suillus americanus]|nr:hypothetical protein BDR03DRAFT_936586 [Suillus americanus]